MIKAEEYIKNKTRGKVNHITENFPWITTIEALEAVEIAREEMLNEICEWIEENIGEYCDGEHIMYSATHMENIDVFGQERFINDLKQAMKDE